MQYSLDVVSALRGSGCGPEAWYAGVAVGAAVLGFSLARLAVESGTPVDPPSHSFAIDPTGESTVVTTSWP